MSPEEWGNIVAWVDERFPGGWRPEQAVAYFRDLEEFDSSDVWAAVYSTYEKGREFAPNGSVLRSAALAERARDARREYRPELPEPDVEKISLADYTTRRFGEVLSAQEMIERIWREQHA